MNPSNEPEDKLQPPETHNLPTEPPAPAPDVTPEQPVQVQTTSPARSNVVTRAFLIFITLSISLFVLSYLVPSYGFVNTMTYVFFYGGVLGSLILGGLVGRETLNRVKRSTQQPIPPSTSLKAIILAIVAFLAVAGSLAVAIFGATIFLSIRACELSGSSKCY